MSAIIRRYFSHGWTQIHTDDWMEDCFSKSVFHPCSSVASFFCLGFRFSIPAALFLVLQMLASPSHAGSLNQIILEQIRQMPTGGNYSASHFATIRLESAAHFESGKFFILPDSASPSYCSGATYLVFLKTIERLRATGGLNLNYSTLSQLMIRGQRDGEGIWGRWNANGPGTARLFYELGLGRNFSDFAQAQPGDFMKIFWNNEVGKLEHGHSVIFLGMENRNGIDYVRFWSSNIPSGYGEKSVPRAKIANVIFSRMQSPENLVRYERIPDIDAYLSSLQTKRSSYAEAREKCGF